MDRDQEAGELASAHETRCCVVGAGPAGAVLGLLLARAGVPVTLLESHPDFDRDFRGDTVHPPTLELLAQLGLADRLHALPHSKVRALRLRTKTQTFTLADLGRLRTPYPYVMILPQAKLLELLTDEARRFPHFRLVMRANVQRLVEADGAVRGVRYRDPENRWHEVRADLTVAADGRFSKLRHLAGIEPVKTAPPMDVVWFRLPKEPADASESAELYVGGGRFAVIFDRGDEWQVGYAVLKGNFAAVKAAGIAALRQGLAELVPWLADRAGHLHDWSQVAVLNVESSRVERWYKPGLLLIGDAAHVMSPVAGVGINVAIQDAVAAANLLTEPLRRGAVTDRDLAAVQKQRESAVRVVQRIQRVMQDRIAAPGLDAGHEFRPPWWLRLVTSIPGLRNVLARMLAFGPGRVRLREPPPRA
ncbi:MAG TPA: FAD-dependent oxidoreductase [Gemmataceae bacterium]|jgi:2-polyprenyl-6-methoxyphenol hydroxylase-like FAD-dependent oxidoreductase|nr:FAD-dependent oxidoreductase [Gemmataceae bacterium]